MVGGAGSRILWIPTWIRMLSYCNIGSLSIWLLETWGWSHQKYKSGVVVTSPPSEIVRQGFQVEDCICGQFDLKGSEQISEKAANRFLSGKPLCTANKIPLFHTKVQSHFWEREQQREEWLVNLHGCSSFGGHKELVCENRTRLYLLLDLYLFNLK